MYTFPCDLLSDALVAEGLYTCITCLVQAQIKEIVLGSLIWVSPLRDTILTRNTDSVNTDLLTVDFVEGEEIGAVVDDWRPAACGGACQLTGRCKPAKAKYNGEGDETEEEEGGSDGLAGIIVVECTTRCCDDA